MKTTNARLALEKYALKPLPGGQFTSVDSVDKTIFWVYFTLARSTTEKLTALFFEESMFSHFCIYIKEDPQIGVDSISLLRVLKVEKGKLTKIPDIF